MQSRKLIIFGTITAMALAAAVVVTHLRAPASQAEKALLFPELRARTNEVGEIHVVGHDRSVTLARQGNNWTISEADGYPALAGRVRDTVLGVAQLRKLADKTSNAKMFKRLGVEDVTEPGSNSVLLQMKDNKGTDLAALIVGRARGSSSRAESPALYVRLPGAANALLVEGQLDVSTDLGKWFSRDLFDITPDRVRSLEIVHADGSRVQLARAMPGGDLVLADVPRGREAQSSVVLSRMGTVLETFFLEGARAAGNVNLPPDAPVMTVRTFEGIVATLVSGKVDDKPMTRISFAFEEPPADAASAPTEAENPAAPAPEGADAGATPAPMPEPKDYRAEAGKYNALVQDWVFQVPQFKFELLTRRLDDLVREPLHKGESPIKLPE